MAVRAAPVPAHRREVASDSEDDLATSDAVHNLSPTSATDNSRSHEPMPPKAAKATNTAVKRKAVSRKPRRALQDRTNVQHDNEIDEFEDDEASKPKPKRAKQSATSTSRKGATARASSEPAEDATKTASTPLQPIASTGAKRGRPKKIAEPALTVIPESQPILEEVEEQHIEQSIEIEKDKVDGDGAVEPSTLRVQPVASRQRSTSVQRPLQQTNTARSASVQSHNGYPAPPSRERSGSVVSDARARERRGGDPELRRRFNDLQSKHEILSSKYQNLQELGRDSAVSNFEKLKRASDQRAKDAAELVASLKRELSELRKNNGSNAETTQLQKQVNNLTTSNNKLLADVKAVNDTLQTSQNEFKALETKLVAARQQISIMVVQERERAKVPGSATKALNGGRGVAANASDAVKDAKMKENLYSDLTGLIIRGVKRKEGEDEYDCIQTGRNGTLHFHLSVANDSSTSNPKTPTGLSYEEAEFAYEPLLDQSRDRDLLELLPDYLTEEICFPRSHAVKFYTRVVDSMTKRIVVEAEEED
ncbi:hypothetical protein K431DRAFT_338447 [Polychaeton citri CBS 116435]|uniref:Monopolin complex subunit Csm1/Pcs1 C-terminal domain-containing protein n=1 Tax=Polychaeton citri CBS 116435 TaxID=1314669 RepID=A0A9P4Q8Z6_9PEZI|nr:hypothetical protein K431DRAFT_338447 [Polychaeton citri CBS 116435]